MPVPRPSCWRLNLILVVLVSLFAANGWLVWDRRAAWHVVETLPGTMPGWCDWRTSVPSVVNAIGGTITFADTGEMVALPPEYRGSLRDVHFASSRAAFRFTGGPNKEASPEDRCWNMAAHREVPLPTSAWNDWQLSPSGTRILARDLKNGAPRRFQIIDLNGSILHERVLPALPLFKRDGDYSSQVSGMHRFSAEGNFLIVKQPADALGAAVRIYDLASEASWTFEDDFGDLTDDGLLWLSVRTLTSDGGGAAAVRAVHLRTGQELWRTPIPEGVGDVGFLGKNMLAVRCADKSVSLYEAASGRKLYTLEKGSELCYSANAIEIRQTGPEFFLQCWGAWSLETGRLVCTKVDRLPVADFFSDGRRALRPGTHQPLPSALYPDVVDLETGCTLFRFESSPPPAFPLYARRAGDRVLTATEGYRVLLWEQRHPEGWKGHLQRPEVLVAIFLGATILVLWASRPRHESLP